jgi:glycosyltransferase involved in cell wall biosynthesis
MAAPSVSIIVPTYNSERYIAETLASVLLQTFTDFEVLVIDDGSTDEQNKIIQDYVSRDSRIKYFYQKNGGVSSARNHGISRARGEYFAFLDSDDVWLPHNLDTKMKALRNVGFGLAHSDAVVIDENSEPVNQVIRGIGGNVLDELLLWRGTQIPGPSSVLVKREVMDKVGNFDEALSTAADKDFFIRVAAHFEIERVPEVTWKYRLHANNMHKNISAMEHDVLYLYEKARKLKLFRSKSFERQCFSSMYLILAASWAGDGKNIRKAFPFLWLAMKKNPGAIVNIVKRVVAKWM